MKGKDCMREEKIRFVSKCIACNPEEIVVYSDSKSDLPLLLWADKGVVVSRERHREWVAENKLEEYMLFSNN